MRRISLAGLIFVMLFVLMYTTQGLSSDPCKTEIPKAKQLLEQGVDVNAGDEYQRTSLHYAAYCGETELAALLIQKGAGVSARDYEQNTPLHMAACGSVGHTEVAALLIQRRGRDSSSLP